MARRTHWIVLAGLVLAGAATFAGRAQDKKPPVPEQERAVKESDVPAAALAALKTLAGSAPFTEFAEEIEYGHKFYEGSWKGPDGNVDGLVTEFGDVVELEESIPAGKVPAAVRAAVEKEAGKGVKVSFERKTLTLYEAHFRKEGKDREMMYTPDARRYFEHAATRGDGKPAEPDDDEHDHD